MNWIAVALGGAIGALCRYAMVLKFPKDESVLSSPILWANALGCFGFALMETYLRAHPSEMLRLFFMVGAMGALTTFSSYVFEVLHFSKTQSLTQAALALFAHLALGLTCLLLGMALGRFCF